MIPENRSQNGIGMVHTMAMNRAASAGYRTTLGVNEAAAETILRLRTRSLNYSLIFAIRSRVSTQYASQHMRLAHFRKSITRPAGQNWNFRNNANPNLLQIKTLAFQNSDNILPAISIIL